MHLCVLSTIVVPCVLHVHAAAEKEEAVAEAEQGGEGLVISQEPMGEIQPPAGEAEEEEGGGEAGVEGEEGEGEGEGEGGEGEGEEEGQYEGQGKLQEGMVGGDGGQQNEGQGERQGEEGEQGKEEGQGERQGEEGEHEQGQRKTPLMGIERVKANRKRQALLQPLGPNGEMAHVEAGERFNCGSR